MTESAQTLQQFDTQLAACRQIFVQKLRDYGASWSILRLPSITDQIFIKARRIRSIEEKNSNKVGESIEESLRGIVNYCIMAVLLARREVRATPEQPLAEEDLPFLEQRYDAVVAEARQLLARKNHDYGEAWRAMRPASYTDLMLVKILRIRQMETHPEDEIQSEGADSNYLDVLNYAVFYLITLSE